MKIRSVRHLRRAAKTILIVVMVASAFGAMVHPGELGRWSVILAPLSALLVAVMTAALMASVIHFGYQSAPRSRTTRYLDVLVLAIGIYMVVVFPLAIAFVPRDPDLPWSLALGGGATAGLFWRLQRSNED